ncbi:MAG: hypothetical protein WD187_02600 [Candidatus Woykebacteria bacterium]
MGHVLGYIIILLILIVLIGFPDYRMGYRKGLEDSKANKTKLKLEVEKLKDE